MASASNAGQKKRKSSDLLGIVSIIMAGQKKSKSSDGQTIVRPAPVSPGIIPFEDLLEIPRVSPHEDLITLSTPAESSSASNHLPYHVFINHCGSDTKHNIASGIYNELSGQGVRVFLDKDVLKPGNFFPYVLKEAIVKASLHIAIFSEKYAQSHWCLRELELMLQTKATFIPVFYRIEPETLRCVLYGKGVYASALDEYKKKNRYSTSKLENWRGSLHKASYHVGVKINDQCGQEEGVKNVVTRVLEELKTMRLDVAKHPVGLEGMVQDFESTALQSMGPIQIVGIWGMGGAGKTTLAMHLYNKKCSTKRSSFLFDVRDADSRGQLHEKQIKLLEDLNLKAGIANFDNKEGGKGILRNRLKSVSVLIVLDDVDHIDQLDALIPARDTLGDGSLIIVTTRELHVLKAWNISAIYEIKPLDPFCAEELFCWHAFGQPSPVIDFKELVKKFADACCCLPLSLKVLGSLLCGNLSQEYWWAQLKKLSRILPKDINLRLKISYDSLEDEEKEMFLDVACFFIGWSSSSTIEVWEGSEWSGLLGWKSLVNKCLVEIKEDNKIRMHDHLRDLGREIANEQSPYRIWSKTQKIKIHPLEKAIQIRGMANAFGQNCSLQNGKIRLNTSQGVRKLEPGSLGLKIFIGGGDFIKDECSGISSELLCFRCDKFEHKSLPSWLPLRELRILELSDLRQLEDLWECDDDAPSQLRQLQIDNCYELKKLSGLRRLELLQTLKLHECSELKTLSLAGLTSLKEIALKFCHRLEKIESSEGLPSLADAPSQLRQLQIVDCNGLKKISGLRRLKLLQTLKIYYCRELKTLSSLAGLTSLKEIKLTLCAKLEKIEGIEDLRSLEKLEISFCFALDTLHSLAGLTSLKEIDLRSAQKLEKIGSLEGLRALEKLEIGGNTALVTLPSLAELTSLKEIKLTFCEKLEKIEGIEDLRSLEKLKIGSCPALVTLPSLAELTSLEEFELTGCQKVDKVEGLEVLASLKKLKVHMSSMRPCVLKLPGQSERLKLVEVATNRAVVEPTFIRDIQKWPREEIIFTRTMIDVMSLRNFFTSFLPEDVVQTFSSEYLNLPRGVKLRMPEVAADANGILICTILQSPHTDLSLEIVANSYRSFSTKMINAERIGMDILPQESIWVWMGVFPHQAHWLRSEEYTISLSWPMTVWYDQEEEKTEVEGWLMRGTEQSIREAFHRLSQS